MRRVARSLALVTSAFLVFIAVTGWGHRHEPTAVTHRSMSHGLLIYVWSAIPIAVSFTLTGHRRPFTAAARVFALLALLGLLFLASLTGYLGPSNGATEPFTLVRFQLLHFWVLPTFALALTFAWYYWLGPDPGISAIDAQEPESATASRGGETGLTG